MSKRGNKENEEPLSGPKKARLSASQTASNNNQAEQANKMTSKQAIDEFKCVLKNTKNHGDYSVSGEATELPALPNLHVKNFGPVSLPLNDSQANDLLKVSAQAPFGKNQSTLIDINVRDSYQLDPSQVDIKHPDWTNKLNLLVERVAKEMGCANRNVTAKLYKMLLYKKGGHFLKHRDTEKEKNMFATLVIQLPSAYTGGELTVYNNGQMKTYDFGQSSGKANIAMHFTAHYVDLEHEIKPITSGYRLALVYSLCSSDSFVLNLSKTDTTTHFSNVLNSLSSLEKPIAIALDHKYTHASFSNSGLMALKGIDAERYKLLKTASNSLSNENQFCFYIVEATLISPKNLDDCDRYDRYGRYGRHYDDEEDEEDEKDDEDIVEKKNNNGTKGLTARDEEKIESEDEYGYLKSKYLKKWYDSNGNSIFENEREISLDFFWKMFDFANGACDKIDSWMFKDQDEEYTGNEGNTITTTYNKYLLAIWSKKSEFSIMARVSMRKALDSIVNDSNVNTRAANLRKLLNMMSSNDADLSSDNSEDDESDNSIEEIVDHSSNLLESREIDGSFYDKLTRLVISDKNPKIVKLFIEIISSQKSVSVKTKSIHSIWKENLVKISELRLILDDLVKNNDDNLENFEKQTEMLKELKDANLIKFLIKKAIKVYAGSHQTYSVVPSNYYSFISSAAKTTNNSNRSFFLEKAIGLIAENGWQSISQTFFDYLSPVTSLNVIESCKLTQGLFSLNQTEMASNILENYVLPILNSNSELNNLRHGSNNIKSIYNICKTLVMFKREKKMVKLRDNVLVSLSQDQLTSLLNEFINEKNSSSISLSKSAPIAELFTNRIKLLEQKLNNSNISWVMSGSVRGHSEVEAFLRSEQRQLIYRGSGMPSGAFQQKTTADNFVKNFSGFKTGYSVEMTVVKNLKEKPYVLINKTSVYFDSIKAVKQTSYRKEIKSLKSFFN